MSNPVFHSNVWPPKDDSNLPNEELRYKIKHQISKHTGNGTALNSYATLKEINELGDEIMELVKAYGDTRELEGGIEELVKLPNCTIESKFHGSTNVILVKDVVERLTELEALKDKTHE